MRSPKSEKAATIRDVARLAGVSIASASRALNGLPNVTDTTRERILGAAKMLRFVPHHGARALSTRRTRTVGMVLPDLYGEFFSELLRGVDLGARSQDFHLLVASSHGDAAEATLAMRSMRGRVDGMLVMSPHVDAALLSDNLDADLPVLLMNAPDAGPRFPAIRVDNYGAAYKITRHLLEGGRTKIAYVGGPVANYEAQERRRGYEDALGPAHAPRVAEGDFTEDSGRQAMLAFARSDEGIPDAVFAANDTMAVGCLLALRELGLRVPEDVALAGFDDIPIARLVSPALTTARVPIAEIGARALARLVHSIEEGGEPGNLEVFSPELVIRESTAPAARSNG